MRPSARRFFSTLLPIVLFFAVSATSCGAEFSESEDEDAARCEAHKKATAKFGPGEWPSHCWKPYRDDSPFNTPIGDVANRRLHPRSQQIVDRILGRGVYPIPQLARPNHLIASESGYAGEPTYWVDQTDSSAGPLFTIDCVEFGGQCSIDGRQIRIPAGAVVEGNVAADPALPWQDRRDAHMTVIDQSNKIEYDLWQVQTSPLPATGGVLTISWGGYTKLDGDGIAETDPATGRTGQGTAAHFGSLAGRLRAEELSLGGDLAPHALFLVVNCDSGSFVYPAKGVGRPCSEVFGTPDANIDAPPMGARLWLQMDAQAIADLPIPKWKKYILHTLRAYGGFIGDTGAQGYFGIETESGNMYSSYNRFEGATYTDPWWEFGKSNWEFYDPPGPDPVEYVGKLYGDTVDWDAQVWSHLRVLDPCVSSNNCLP
jgi:hypothetical protein